MLSISDSAQQHFRRLLEQQGLDGLGIRIKAIHAGTPKADCSLEFCEAGDLDGAEIQLACEGFALYVDGPSAPFLEGADIDYQASATGGQLTIRAPKIKGVEPAADASLAERVAWVLQVEVNPQIAAHGGRVSLVDIVEENVVLLRFGGGCHGCGMADVTLKQGIERTLRARLPEITAVRDITDHAGGQTPYYKARSGSSAMG